jgi:hypothetical protein
MSKFYYVEILRSKFTLQGDAEYSIECGIAEETSDYFIYKPDGENFTVYTNKGSFIFYQFEESMHIVELKQPKEEKKQLNSFWSIAA